MEKTLLEKLLESGRQRKETLMRVLDVDERSARGMIEVVGYDRPVIAVSSTAGYKIAMEEADVAEVRQTISEFESRIRRLQLRLEPLKAFEAQYES